MMERIWRLSLTLSTSITLAFAILVFHDWAEPYVRGLSAQDVMWKAYLWLGAWWWAAGAALSLLGFWYICHLTAPKTKWGAATRVPLVLGFLFYILSWGCPPFEPLAGMLLLLGVVMILKQVSEACAAERREQPPLPTLSQKALFLLSGHHPARH